MPVLPLRSTWQGMSGQKTGAVEGLARTHFKVPPHYSQGHRNRAAFIHCSSVGAEALGRRLRAARELTVSSHLPVWERQKSLLELEMERK